MVNAIADWTNPAHVCGLSCSIEHVMRGAPVVDPEYSVRMTAQTMIMAKAGAAVVCDLHRPMTIVTEHDLVRALSGGADPDRARIAEVGSTPTDTLDATGTIGDAVRLMSHRGSDYVSVKAHGDIVGLVTVDDLVEVLNGTLPSLTSA